MKYQIMVLASRASGRYLDIQILQNLPSEYPIFFVRNFLTLRPLQFNYLSYELFLEKKSCQTPKKKKKSHLWCLTDESGFKIFCQTPKKKKKVQVLRIFFVSVIQSTTGSYHCCSRVSDLRRYTSHPSGYRD